jgi:hypothetical protein
MIDQGASMVHTYFYFCIQAMNTVLVEVENADTISSDGGGETSGSQTQSSVLQQIGNAIVSGAEGVSVQTLTILSRGILAVRLKR